MTLSGWLSELLPSAAPTPTPGPATLVRMADAFAWAPSAPPTSRGSACPEEEARLHAMAAVEQWEVEPESGPMTSRGASVAEMRGLLIEEEEE